MSRRGWVLFIAMSLIWGVPYLLIKVADGGAPVPVLILAGSVLATQSGRPAVPQPAGEPGTVATVAASGS